MIKGRIKKLDTALNLYYLAEYLGLNTPTPDNLELVLEFHANLDVMSQTTAY